MTINFSLDELIEFQQKGTLESHLLSHGLLPMDVLKVALDLAEDRVNSLEEEINNLEKEWCSLE